MSNELKLRRKKKKKEKKKMLKKTTELISLQARYAGRIQYVYIRIYTNKQTQQQHIPLGKKKTILKINKK